LLNFILLLDRARSFSPVLPGFLNVATNLPPNCITLSFINHFPRFQPDSHPISTRFPPVSTHIWVLYRTNKGARLMAIWGWRWRWRWWQRQLAW